MGQARSHVFAPLGDLGRAEAVTARLVDAISMGLLADGEQLPSEAELAGQFGVATVTVREALVALRQQELVETRRGRGGGSFVITPSDGSPASWRQRLREVSLSELRDIGDHYLAVAGAAARLAAERSSPEDVERLRLATEDLRKATAPAEGRLVREGPEDQAGRRGRELAAARAERQFHLEVAAAAQSPRLTHQEIQLQGERGGLLWLPPSANAHEEHRAITEAIAHQDGELARKLTEEHILQAVDRLVDMHLELLDP
ncbi:FadR/GntR family transcriptional regulator [Kutzneria sp. CA-103260]|uniref:FadR/GntR family transcriptional regulator n=1 Tax=Kutzneria sp. CA-103260 TaxID=2802641 RepID=UPI001BA5DE67|nr:GntR family transcriptional regulator [Kutzneria sp. CA-103260]QUQ68047.1 GntR family transcriptional regulator [Kutzneria sp. CA-103260]